MMQKVREWNLARERLVGRIGKRFGIPYFQRVAEGVIIQRALQAPFVAHQDFCLHPLA